MTEENEETKKVEKQEIVSVSKKTTHVVFKTLMTSAIMFVSFVFFILASFILDANGRETSTLEALFFFLLVSCIIILGWIKGWFFLLLLPLMAFFF
ncbi:MAG: hypothetical protein J6Y03_05445 [Alphaproteobacteria bacterium]|nr:hypothetical protein [Alphaproteobacteria bacterium]